MESYYVVPIMLLLILLVLLVVVLALLLELSGRVKHIAQEVKALRVGLLPRSSASGATAPQPVRAHSTAEAPRPSPVSAQPTAPPEPVGRPVVHQEPVEAHVAAQPATVPHPRVQVEAAAPVRPVVQRAASAAPLTPKPKTGLFGKVNWESFIGEQLLSKIGIAVLVIGIGLFVKYAIDNDWINEVGRVLIGFLAGGLLVGVAHWLSRSYRAFSSVLVGGAMAVFYFTAYLAFHQYHIFGQTVAFGVMIVITVFTVVLSIAYNRRELAILSMIGGYLTPFMVSSGEGNYHVLFSYLALLNVGMLSLAIKRQWVELNFMGLAFTLAIYVGYIYNVDSAVLPGRIVPLLMYGAGFYLIFTLMPLLQLILRKQQGLRFGQAFLLTTNSLAYFFVGAYLLGQWPGDTSVPQGIFTVAMAALHFAIALGLRRVYAATDRSVFYLFLAMVLSYAALLEPVLLGAENIALFFAVELVVFGFLYYKSGHRGYLLASLAFLVLLVVRLPAEGFAQSEAWDYENPPRVLANMYFATRFFASMAMAAYLYILLRSKHDADKYLGNGVLPGIVALLTVAATYFTGTYEVIGFSNQVLAVFSLYNLLFVAGLALVLWRVLGVERMRPWLRWLGIYAVAVFMLYLIFGERYHASMLYWGNIVALLGLLALIIYGRYVAGKLLVGRVFVFYFAITAVVTIAFSDLVNFYFDSGAAITVTWGVLALLEMGLGMRLRIKPLRVLALLLLFLALVKLFAYDLSDAGIAAKILAFTLLGVFLLFIAFMYQKLKKILFDDEKTDEGIGTGQ